LIRGVHDTKSKLRKEKIKKKTDSLLRRNHTLMTQAVARKGEGRHEEGLKNQGEYSLPSSGKKRRKTVGDSMMDSGSRGRNGKKKEGKKKGHPFRQRKWGGREFACRRLTEGSLIRKPTTVKGSRPKKSNKGFPFHEKGLRTEEVRYLLAEIRGGEKREIGA